jgi:acetyl esterase/lipase
MNSTSQLHSTPVRGSAPALLVIAVLALLLLVGPTPRADANPPFSLEVDTGIVYGGSPGTALDVYVPDFPGNAKLPLLIWTNGCAWLIVSCGTAGTQEIAEEFNPRGYAVAGVGIAGTDFLLTGPVAARFPTQLHDVRAAVRWLRQHAADYNLDPTRFAVMGFSSGGWTSAIAGATSDEAQLPGEPDTNGLSTGVSSAVQAVVGFSSPTDFLQMNQWYVDNPGVPSFIDHDAPLAPLPPPWSFLIPPNPSPESLLVGCTDNGNLLGIQTCPDETEAANPITYVEGSEVPMLLLHGENDPLVPNGQSQLLYDALAAAGNEVTFISVAGAGHNVNDPPGFLGPPIIGASAFTVYHTNRGGQETVKNKPAPTWETIEDFIHVQLSRARGR